MVDKHVATLATCLRDRNALIRKQSLVLLSNLISQDYIKMRDVFFYRFVVCLVDSSHEVQQAGKGKKIRKERDENIHLSLCLFLSFFLLSLSLSS
jgi:hypothetical protein